MKNLILWMILIAAGAILSMSSCAYDWIEYDEPVIPDTVSFSNDIMPIFNKSCNTAGCHSAGGFDPDLSPGAAYGNLTTGGYIDTDNPEGSTLYLSITSGSMNFYAQPGDADLILEWIKDGAKDN